MKENLYPFFRYEIFTKHHTFLFKILVILVRFESFGFAFAFPRRRRFSIPRRRRLSIPVGGDFQFFDVQSEWNSITCGATLYTDLTLIQ